MAVTGFWPVFKNLKATPDYADNPDKTTAQEYLDEDLYAALRYAENDDKTDRKMFVGGINCSAQNAYAEMIAVQRRFGLRGKVVGYHGIQSFREGEVTPEQAFEIGKETARRMWGDRYQVLVTVHLNTDNICLQAEVGGDEPPRTSFRLNFRPSWSEVRNRRNDCPAIG